MGRRIDAVVLSGPVVFVVEFKVGEREFERAALDQVWDYALDLKNFHEVSHAVAIVPILVATEAAASPAPRLQADEDRVYRPVTVRSGQFREVIDLALKTIAGEALEGQKWSGAPYRPTPTIIEAARALYSQHSVEAIKSFDAGKLDTHHRELLAAVERQAGRINTLEAGVARLWPGGVDCPLTVRLALARAGRRASLAPSPRRSDPVAGHLPLSAGPWAVALAPPLRRGECGLSGGVRPPEFRPHPGLRLANPLVSGLQVETGLVPVLGE